MMTMDLCIHILNEGGTYRFDAAFGYGLFKHLSAVVLVVTSFLFRLRYGLKTI